MLESRVEVTQGYPLLIVQTDVGEMRIGLEQKFADRGILFAGPAMAGVLPPIKLAGDRENGQAPLTLQGFTRDKEIGRLLEEFRAQYG